MTGLATRGPRPLMRTGGMNALRAFGEFRIRQKNFLVAIRIGDVALFTFGPLGQCARVGRQRNIRATPRTRETQSRSRLRNRDIESQQAEPVLANRPDGFARSGGNRPLQLSRSHAWSFPNQGRTRTATVTGRSWDTVRINRSLTTQCRVHRECVAVMRERTQRRRNARLSACCSCGGAGVVRRSD